MESTTYAVLIQIFRLFPPKSANKSASNRQAKLAQIPDWIAPVVFRFMGDCGKIRYVILLKIAAVIFKQVGAKDLEAPLPRSY